MDTNKDFQLIHITDAIRNAILACLYKDHGNVKKHMAIAVGVKQQMVGQWCKDQRGNMKRETWLKLLPHIQKYLDAKNLDLPTLKDLNNPCIKLCHGMESWEIEIVKKFKELPVSDKLNIHTVIDNLRKEGLKNTPPTPIKTNQTTKAGGF